MVKKKIVAISVEMKVFHEHGNIISDFLNGVEFSEAPENVHQGR